MTLAAEDLLRMALNNEHFEVVAAYAPGHSTAIAHESAAAGLLRATFKE